jgi:ABC-type uncharacterized transport system substrate-binding protein
MYQWPEMAEEGGFAGYGPRITQWYRQLARLLVQVLRGAKPGDLPVEQPTLPKPWGRQCGAAISSKPLLVQP